MPVHLRKMLIAALTAAGLAACQGGSPPPPQTASPPPPQATAPAGAGIRLSPEIPHDVTVAGKVDLPSLQHDFDVLSWNSFIALNWPPDPDGKGDPKKTIGQNGDNRAVWEGWIENTDIFLPGGAKPQNPPVRQIPAICPKNVAGARVFTQIAKVPNSMLEASIQPFETGPLIDQNGQYARFEILVNDTLYDYIFSNGLYSKAGQNAFKGTVAFPAGDNSTPEVGAILIKAAWKILEDPASEAPRFHTSRVLVYTPPSTNPKIEPTCTVQTVGLVGLHIAHKTASSPQWIWSTFEHVDNDPSEADVKSGKLASKYNFFNPDCKDCVVNEPPPRPWDPNHPGPPTQVVRMDVLPAFAKTSADANNATAKKLLAGVNPKSVWANYELISTQWPTDPQNPVQPFGNPAPQFLANTTLETYVQGTVPNVSSSCIQCHGNATMTNGVASDFTYLLQTAQGPATAASAAALPQTVPSHPARR